MRAPPKPLDFWLKRAAGSTGGCLGWRIRGKKDRAGHPAGNQEASARFGCEFARGRVEGPLQVRRIWRCGCPEAGHPAEQRSMCESRETRIGASIAIFDDIVCATLCMEDRQIFRTDSLAIAGRIITDVPSGELAYLRQCVGLVRRRKGRVICESSSAPRASPSRKETSDLPNVETDQHEEPAGARPVTGKGSLGASNVQAAMWADGHRAGHGPLSDTIRIAGDPFDQPFAIRDIRLTELCQVSSHLDRGFSGCRTGRRCSLRRGTANRKRLAERIWAVLRGWVPSLCRI